MTSTTFTAPMLEALTILATAGHPVEDYDVRPLWDAMDKLEERGLVTSVAFSPDADGYELTDEGLSYTARNEMAAHSEPNAQDLADVLAAW